MRSLDYTVYSLSSIHHESFNTACDHTQANMVESTHILQPFPIHQNVAIESLEFDVYLGFLAFWQCTMSDFDG